MSKFYTALIAILGVIAAFFGVKQLGAQTEKRRESDRRNKAKDNAIEAYKEAEAEADEHIAKKRPNIPRRDYFDSLRDDK